MTPAPGSLPRLEAVLILSATIHCDTGLRIGAAETTIAIGGLDNPVIRSPLTGEPYIPGSSLKGKLRSLLERRYERPQNWGIDRGACMCTSASRRRTTANAACAPCSGSPRHARAGSASAGCASQTWR